MNAGLDQKTGTLMQQLSQAALPLKKRVWFLSSIGAGLEYYDYVIYLYLIHYFSPYFFGTHHLAAARIKGFLFFAVGCVLRPCGAVLWAWLADRVGRRVSVMSIMLVMALSSAFIACLPGYAAWGWGAPVALLLCRLLQSVAFGADLPCGIVFLTEYAPRNKRGWVVSLMIANVGLGSAMGAGVCAALVHFLSPAMMHSWGWRLAFLFGSAVALVALFLRRQLRETPIFVAMQQHGLRAVSQRLVVQDVGDRVWVSVVRAMGLIALPAFMVMLALSFPLICHQIFHYPSAAVYRLLTIGSLFAALLIPIMAKLGDHYGRRRLYLYGAYASVIWLPIGWLYWLPSGQLSHLWLFGLGYHVIQAILAGAFFVLLAEQFQTRVRCRGYALSYNMVYALMSFLPLLVSVLLTRHHFVWSVTILGLCMALVSIVAATFLSTFSPSWCEAEAA